MVNGRGTWVDVFINVAPRGVLVIITACAIVGLVERMRPG